MSCQNGKEFNDISLQKLQRSIVDYVTFIKYCHVDFMIWFNKKLQFIVREYPETTLVAFC